jgi:hypothetical protein
MPSSSSTRTTVRPVAAGGEGSTGLRGTIQLCIRPRPHNVRVDQAGLAHCGQIDVGGCLRTPQVSQV